MIQSFYKEERKYSISTYMFSSHLEYLYGKGCMVGAHFHNYIEILYCTEGNFEAFLNGVRYTFSRGEMIIINSNEIHSVYSCGEEGNKYIVVKVLPELLYGNEQSIAEAKYFLLFMSGNITQQKVFPSCKIDNTDLPAAFVEIEKEFTAKKYGFELSVKLNIFKIFLYIVREYEKNGNAVSSSLDENVARHLCAVLDYLENNYADSINMKQAAEMCFMSYNYFSKLFKKFIGKSFNEYLIDIRLRHAKKLLVSSNVSITEIALNTGFGTTSYFIEAFKKRTGSTPMNFRKKSKEVPDFQ